MTTYMASTTGHAWAVWWASNNGRWYLMSWTIAGTRADAIDQYLRTSGDRADWRKRQRAGVVRCTRVAITPCCGYTLPEAAP